MLDLAGVVLPETMTSLGTRAFYSCDSLKEITIPGKILYVLADTFAMCRRIQTIRISDGVIVVRKNAFNGIIGLRTLYLPKTIIAFEDAIQGSYQLTDVYYAETAEEFAKIVHSEYFDRVNVYYDYQNE